jgi:hypothetical protein
VVISEELIGAIVNWALQQPNPYTASEQEILQILEQSKDLFKDFKFPSGVPIKKGGAVVIDNMPMDFEPPIPHGGIELDIPPTKTTFISEWASALILTMMGFELDGYGHEGMCGFFHSINTREGYHDRKGPRGDSEATFHQDRSAKPFKVIMLLCENPSEEGGITGFLSLVPIVQKLLPEEIDWFKKPLFRIVSGGGSSRKEQNLPIIETDENGNITVIRYQNGFRKLLGDDSTLPLGAKQALKHYMDLVDQVKSMQIKWKRGKAIFLNNHLAVHMRTSFFSNIRHLLRMFAK